MICALGIIILSTNSARHAHGASTDWKAAIVIGFPMLMS
jgi:hypothetical protein